MLRSSARLGLRAGLQNNVQRWEGSGACKRQPEEHLGWNYEARTRESEVQGRGIIICWDLEQAANGLAGLPGWQMQQRVAQAASSEDGTLFGNEVIGGVRENSIGEDRYNLLQIQQRRDVQHRQVVAWDLASPMTGCAYGLGGRSLSVLADAFGPGRQLTSLRAFARYAMHSSIGGDVQKIAVVSQAGAESREKDVLLGPVYGGLIQELHLRASRMMQLHRENQDQKALQLYDPEIVPTLHIAKPSERRTLFAVDQALRRAIALYFTAAVRVACQLEDANQALQMADAMKACGLRVGFVVACCILRALCRVGRREDAVKYLAALDRSQQNSVMYNTVLSSCVWSKRTVLFKECLHLMAKNAVPRDSYTWILVFRSQAGHSGFRGLQQLRDQLPLEFKDDPSVLASYILAVLPFGQLDHLQQEVKALLASYALHTKTAGEEPSASAADADRLEAELEQALKRLKQAQAGHDESSAGPSSGFSNVQGDAAEDDALGVDEVRTEAQMRRGSMHAAGRVVTMAANRLMFAALRARELSIVQEVADALRKSGAPLDVYSFSSFMQLAVAEGAPPEQAEELLLEMEARGVEPSNQIFLFLMQAYIGQGDISGAEGVLARIFNRGLQPVSQHFNTLLKAHYEAGNLEAMTELYADMRASAIVPNAYTFGFLFKGATLVPHPWTGMRQGLSVEDGEVSRVHQLVLDYEDVAVAVDGWLEDARSLNIPLVGPLLTYVVKALGYTDQRPRMLEMLETQLWQEGWRRDLVEARVTVAATLASLARFGDVQASLDVWRRMEEEGMEPDKHIYTAFINACAQGRRPQQAHALVREMQSRGIQPDVWTYNALIKAECIAGDVAKAARVVDTMEAAGCTPNDHTWGVLLQTAELASRADLAAAVDARKAGKQGVFSEMLKAETLAAFGAGFGDDSDDEYLW